MTSAGPAPAWWAPPAAALPMPAKMPGADDGADAERDQLDRPERPLQLVRRLLRVGEDRVERFFPEERVAHAGRAAGYQELRLGSGRQAQSRRGTSVRLRIRSGTPVVPLVPIEQQRSRARAARAPSTSSRGESPTCSASPGATPSRRQVRWKISGVGLAGWPRSPKPKTTSKAGRGRGPRAARGRCESQFEMTASARPRAPRARRASAGRRRRWPRSRARGSAWPAGRRPRPRRRPRRATARTPDQEVAPEVLLAGDSAVAVAGGLRPGPRPRPRASASRRASGSNARAVLAEHAAVDLLDRRIRVQKRGAGVEADGADHRPSADERVLPHHAVERAVERVAAAAGRLERLRAGLRRVGHAAERLALDLPVPHVGLLVDREEPRRVLVGRCRRRPRGPRAWSSRSRGSATRRRRARRGPRPSSPRASSGGTRRSPRRLPASAGRDARSDSAAPSAPAKRRQSAGWFSVPRSSSIRFSRSSCRSAASSQPACTPET